MKKTELFLKYFLVVYCILQATLVTKYFQGKYVLYYFVPFVFLLAAAFKRMRAVPLIGIIMFMIITSLAALFYLDAPSMAWNSSRGLMVLIISSYCIISFTGKDFFRIFEVVVLFMSIASIPFYVLHMLSPGIISSVAGFFTRFTQRWYLDIGGINLIFYSYLPKAIPRNCGFMWEPGAFAMLLIVAQIIRLIRNDGKIDLPIIIYIILNATTMSTMGYIANIFLIGSVIFFSKRSSVWLKALFMVLLVISLPTILYLDFILPKIERYLYSIDSGGYSSIHGTLYYSRLGLFYQVIKNTIEWPFGIGWHNRLLTADYENMYGVGAGVGTISEWLLRWGIIGLTFVVSTIYKCIHSMNKTKISSLIYTITLLMALFSNPTSLMYWTYCFVFYVFTEDYKNDVNMNLGGN